MKNKINYKRGEEIGECIFLEERETLIFAKTNKSKRIRRRRVALFRCKCGNEFEAIISLVKRGNTNSCGCLRIPVLKKMHDISRTHGKTNHILYHVWKNMVARCEEPNSVSYNMYGARGIKVCDEWHNINNFINDMYPSYKRGLQLDRKDNNGNYCKENCRWVTRLQNANNRRDNRIVEFNGEKKTVSEWARHNNISTTALLYRLNKWNDVERALTQKLPMRWQKN